MYLLNELTFRTLCLLYQVSYDFDKSAVQFQRHKHSAWKHEIPNIMVLKPKAQEKANDANTCSADITEYQL